ncbi:zinc metallopeptidase [bacterium]|nr:zinc metallopeptidase [bacterium]
MELMIIFLLMLIIPVYASIKVNLSYKKYLKIDNEKKLTGFDVARRILDENNLGEIYVVETKGTMSDHYDPGRKTVRLSTDVYHGTSISSLAIAAHECGHAIQDKEGYTWFKIRSMIFPIINIGQKIAYVVMIIGLFLSYMNYVYAAIGFTFLGLLFELVTLPVEFDASKRAKSIVLSDGMISDSEKSGVDAVLNSTAFTYVAAVISSMLEMLYLLMQLNDRD